MTAPIDPVGPRLSPRRRRTFRITLIALAAVLLAATTVALGVAAWGVSTIRMSSDRQALPAAMRSLVIDTARIPTAIRITESRDTTDATAELRLVDTSRSKADRLQVSHDGTQTRIAVADTPSGALRWARGGEIIISLPPEQARRLSIQIRQHVGVVIAHVNLDQLTARTRNGSVLLGGAARRVEIHTVDGKIASREPITVTEEFSATTSDGDITVDFRDVAPPKIGAASRDGDVLIGLPEPGPYLVRAQSGESTRIRVPETTDAGAAAAEVTARSDEGDVVVDGVGNGRRFGPG